MRNIKNIIFAILLISIFSVTACDDKKDDKEKHEKVIVNHTYNNNVLTISYENKNEEAVIVELYAIYYTSITSSQPAYITDKIKLGINEKQRKEYPLNNNLPHNLNLTYKVY